MRTICLYLVLLAATSAQAGIFANIAYTEGEFSAPSLQCVTHDRKTTDPSYEECDYSDVVQDLVAGSARVSGFVCFKGDLSVATSDVEAVFKEFFESDQEAFERVEETTSENLVSVYWHDLQQPDTTVVNYVGECKNLFIQCKKEEAFEACHDNEIFNSALAEPKDEISKKLCYKGNVDPILKDLKALKRDFQNETYFVVGAWYRPQPELAKSIQISFKEKGSVKGVGNYSIYIPPCEEK